MKKILIIVLVFMVIFISGCVSNQNKPEENKVSISKDNFAFIDYEWLNSGYDKMHCNDDNLCEDMDGNFFTCPKVDMLKLKFRVINLDSLTWVSCSVTDGYNNYYNQGFAEDSITKIAEMTFPYVAYNKEHVFLICCVYDDGNFRSDEFCLNPVNIKSLC